MKPSPYAQLLDLAREVALLESTAAVLQWDQETMMPPRGVEHRARQLALLARLVHEKATAPAFADALARCERDPDAAADGVAAANVRELRRAHDRITKVPAALVTELAETTSLAQHAWAEARQASDFARFRPWLEKIVALQRRRADCLGWPADGEPFDALLEDYEPRMTARELHAIFTPLRARLTALLGDLQDNGTPPDARFLEVRIPIEAQEALVREVVAALGFDFERGRLDRSTHPFSTGFHSTDVRITTRFRDDNVLDALGSTMHEAGHGMYEQGLLPEHAGTPLGAAVSLGIHESQSRLWENQVGRSRAFWTWCQPVLQRCCGAAARGFTADELFGAANLVTPDFIRVEADEVTYHLHIMVRFRIELALLRGDLAPRDVPGEWNRLYHEFLGLRVPDDRRGCLQDVHWSCGMLGYFPTYTLGDLYAAQLFGAARRTLPDLEGQLARGELAPLKKWLNDEVHAHGQRYPAAELCRRATGESLSAAPFLDYLEAKSRSVYRLR